MNADEEAYTNNLLDELSAIRALPLVKSVRLYPSDTSSVHSLNDVTVQAVLKAAYVDKNRKRCKVTIHAKTSRPTHLECAVVLRTRLQTEYAQEIGAASLQEQPAHETRDDNLFSRLMACRLRAASLKKAHEKAKQVTAWFAPVRNDPCLCAIKLTHVACFPGSR